ncbi:hypothetical protein K7432_007863 [Basidiobolus ranarum]|uniref:Uncharacterized protein n=1 Tax=Basidiobolus ranarum TaxID=34480 RepID=A0ABR2WT01_9FUNG
MPRPRPYCKDDLGNVLNLTQCVISPKPGILLDLTQSVNLTFIYNASAECNPYGDHAPWPIYFNPESRGDLLELSRPGRVGSSKLSQLEFGDLPDILPYTKSTANYSGYYHIMSEFEKPVDNKWAVGLNLGRLEFECIAPLDYTYVKSKPGTSNASVVRISYALLVFCAMAFF